MARSRIHVALIAALGLAALAVAHSTTKGAPQSDLLHAKLHPSDAHGPESSGMKRAFALLFPFEHPGYNAILGTFYISSQHSGANTLLIPNFILLAVPATLQPSSLNTMIAFATGGLLGDVFLHLVPHAFFGEESEAHAVAGGGNTIQVEPKRNIVIGGAIFLGFAAFFVLDKTMRVLSAAAAGGEGEDGGHGHSHSHGHGHSHSHGPSSAITSATSLSEQTSAELKQRKSPSDVLSTPAKPPVEATVDKAAVNPSLKLSAYLNLFGDFTHNITDGLAMAASFYSSPALGAVTTIATFCHEIPHEIADYSILIKSGFTKTQAMSSQFFTAVGAFVGTFLGIWIAETSGTGKGASLKEGEGFFGTSVAGGELVIPMTAGGFLYIASVSVVPELLAESRSGKQAIKEYLAMAFGVFCMAVIAWNE